MNYLQRINNNGSEFFNLSLLFDYVEGVVIVGKNPFFLDVLPRIGANVSAERACNGFLALTLT